MVTPEFNTLLKRWNLPDGQGNIFNMTGAGLARYQGNNQPCLWTAFLADYESRRWFSLTSRGLSGTAISRNQCGSEPASA